MAMIQKCGEESLNPKYLYRWLKYKIEFSRDHPDYFNADGLLCFAGSQGSGKTISAVNYVAKLMLMYPKCKLVTNLWLPDYPIITFEQFIAKQEEYTVEDIKNENLREYLFDIYMRENRVFLFLDNDDFQKYRNGEFGIIYFVDEIQLYLNSLQSKNINMDVINTVSQQRKQRIHIVSTSQVFGRLAKPLREQFSNVILCKNYYKVLQINKLIDRDSIQGESSAGTEITGMVKKKFMWFHNPDYYKRYDTSYVVERGKFVARENQLEGVYENAVRLSGDS
jgi:hypothetical protein